ncbi:RE37682p, putative [Brugia malayi]|uniref:RE37682p, putative n=1 Tax=Brugia malayi TaxID=6279 RepID=A0A4E9F6W7_BRUMA|nr:RE37682p, putative [Brugia malayi]VIO89771.1 RE37682p, putative [Brugia malayi]
MFDSCFPPLRMCLECVQGPSFSVTQNSSHSQNEQHSVRLDTVFMGDDVVLLKNGQRICGSGIWGIGLATRSAILNSVPVTANCWVLRQDGQVVANGEVLGKLDEPIDESDCIGVAFDHVELKFYKNGVLLPLSISNVKGQVYPIIYVGDNAILDVAFRSFSYNAPVGYEEIMLEQTIL